MPMNLKPGALRRLAIRHRVALSEISLAAAVVAVCAFVLFGLDVFAFSKGHGPPRLGIEADELPLIGTILTVGMLIFAWRRTKEQKRETLKRIAAEQRSRELANLDPLTGLANRRQFSAALEAATNTPASAGAAHALLLLDLNGFKQVNDVYGHGAGDVVLKVIGERLLGIARNGDLVARLGGDEFALLAHHLAGPEAATSIALRIIEALDNPIQAGTASHMLTVGIGISMLSLPSVTPEETLRRADVALYRAKADAISSAHFYDDELDRHVRERAYLERELREAIAAHGIEPFFQPLVDLKTKEIVGFESLARWTHKSMGSISPARFIPVAESSGLIHALFDDLLRRSCRAAMAWPDSVLLAVNVSAAQLRDQTLGLRVLAILAETGLRPGRLELEITETALVRDLEAAKSVLGALRNAGVRLALDDFGTGYSSLYHLRNFKVDKIKIDRSFVDRICSEKESSEIVSALVGLGRGLGFTVTAEGIEGDSQQAELIAKGCELGQGYLFGKAVPAEATHAFFAPKDAPAQTATVAIA